MQRPPTSFPLQNYLVFVALSFVILTAYTFLDKRFRPPPPPAQVAQAENGNKAPAKVEKGAEVKQPGAAQAEKGPPAMAAAENKVKPAGAKPDNKPPAKPARPEAIQWVAIGSADEASPYRMLVTFCNRGAALARIELSNRRYHDLDDRSGYLGHVVMEEHFRRDGAGPGRR